MSEKTLFTRIIEREIPADVIYEDEHCVAFRDINPQAPFHALVVPRKPIAKLADATAEDAALLGKLLLCAAEVARRHGYGDAFRLAVNNGAAVGQTVFHLHVHVLAGRGFSWPPG
ncbi:MAG: histidine triad nucleotide-binding protein [Gammaproteobacteria bacterium]